MTATFFRVKELLQKRNPVFDLDAGRDEPNVVSSFSCD
jgi:hypothetical protein